MERRSAVIERLETIRREGRYSLREWSERIGVKRATYYSWTLGKRSPRLNSVTGIMARCPELGPVVLDGIRDDQAFEAETEPV
jgi:DNA-binding XRE family transcriptional regulator